MHTFNVCNQSHYVTQVFVDIIYLFSRVSYTWCLTWGLRFDTPCQFDKHDYEFLCIICIHVHNFACFTKQYADKHVASHWGLIASHWGLYASLCKCTTHIEYGFCMHICPYCTSNTNVLRSFPSTWRTITLPMYMWILHVKPKVCKTFGMPDNVNMANFFRTTAYSLNRVLA